MKILQSILSPKLYKRFALWYYKTFGSPQTFNRGSLFGAMVALRFQEATAPARFVVSGDSVAAGGEPFFELIEDCRCSAIPGDRTETLLARIKENVLVYQPEAVVLHIGGNDILAGLPMDWTVDNLSKIYDALKAAGVKRIAWLTVLPLAGQFAKAHYAAGELCAIVRRQLKFDVLDVRTPLTGPDGFIHPRYNGDGIHCNALAYNDVFYPIVAKYMRGKA